MIYFRVNLVDHLVGPGSVKRRLVPACDVWVSSRYNTARVGCEGEHASPQLAMIWGGCCGQTNEGLLVTTWGTLDICQSTYCWSFQSAVNYHHGQICARCPPRRGVYLMFTKDGRDQCSKRGSPSVLGLDGEGRRLAVPSGLFKNLPCAPMRRTIGPAVPRRPP